MEEYSYELISTGGSSQKYGNCEMCHKHATEVFYQVESKSYMYNNEKHWTYNKCSNLFGHKECLLSIRK